MIARDDVHISGCEGIMSWWGNDLFPDLVYVDMFVHYAFNYWESLLQYQLCDGDCLDYGIWMVRRFHAPEQHITIPTTYFEGQVIK